MRSICMLTLFAASCSDAALPIEPPPGASGQAEFLYTGAVWGGNLVVGDGRVYFTTYGEPPDGEHSVMMVTREGGSATRLWQGGPGELFGIGMALRDGRLLFAQEASNSVPRSEAVYSVPIEGGERTLVANFPMPSTAYSGITTDDTHVYAAGGNEIIAAPLDGGDATVLLDGPIGWIALAGPMLYFTTVGGVSDSLNRMPVGGGAPETVAKLAKPGRIDVDADAAWVPSDTAIIRVPFDGGPQTRFEVGLPVEVVVRGLTALYAATDDRIFRVPLDGSPPTVLEMGLQNVEILATDDQYVYFSMCCGAVGRIPL